MDQLRDRKGQLVPTGQCWCGCGKPTTEGNFFRHGDSADAQAAVINIEYGSITQFLVAHGYGPGGKNPRRMLEFWREDGGRTR